VDAVTDPDLPASEPAAPAGRPATLLLAIAIAAVEGLAVLAYAAGIALSGFANPESVAAPAVEVLIYVLFAIGIGLVVKGLVQNRRWARTPFVVVQLFGLVTGWTLLQGDGDGTHLLGWAVLVVSAVGLGCALAPRTGEALQE
jgi:hypothetical protein